MQFKCPKDVLMPSINTVQRAVQTSSSIDIYTGIYLSASEGQLTMIGTNIDLSIKTTIAVDVIEEGKVVVEGKLFSDIVRKWPADKPINVALDVNTNNITISDGNDNSSFKAEIKTMNVNDYPSFPDPNPEIEAGEAKLWDIPQQDLKKVITSTAFSAAKADHSRIYLTAILLESKNNELRAVATDTHRLAYYKLPGHDGNISAMITAEDLLDISKLLADNDEMIRLTLTPRRAFFDITNTTIVTRLIEGTFPPYEKVIPTQHRTIVKIGRQELIDAVDRIAVMIRNASTFMVKMTIKDNFMSIASGELEIGKAEEKIYVEQEGEDLIIKMDYRFLFEGLKSLIGEVVEIQFNGSESAILFQSEEMPGFIYIMMPLIV